MNMVSISFPQHRPQQFIQYSHEADSVFGATGGNQLPQQFLDSVLVYFHFIPFLLILDFSKLYHIYDYLSTRTQKAALPGGVSRYNYIYTK